MSRIQLLKNVVDDLHSLADDIRAIADALACDETPVKADATSHEPDQPEISLEEVRAILAEKSHDGFTREIRELLLTRASLSFLRSPVDTLHSLRATGAGVCRQRNRGGSGRYSSTRSLRTQAEAGTENALQETGQSV